MWLVSDVIGHHVTGQWCHRTCDWSAMSCDWSVMSYDIMWLANYVNWVYMYTPSVMASANLDLSPACTPAAISFIFGVTISPEFLRTWVLWPLVVDNLFSGVTGLWVACWAITVGSTRLHLAGPNNNLYPRLCMFPWHLQCDHIINCVTRRHNGGDVREATASVLLLTNSCRKWIMDTVSLVPRPCPAFRHLQYGKAVEPGSEARTWLHWPKIYTYIFCYWFNTDAS